MDLLLIIGFLLLITVLICNAGEHIPDDFEDRD